MKKSKEDERRRHPRKPVDVPARLQDAAHELHARLEVNHHWHDCRIVNISPGGAKVQIKDELIRGKRAHLKIENFGQFSAHIVWRSGDEIGLHFDESTDKMAEVVVGLAVYG